MKAIETARRKHGESTARRREVGSQIRRKKMAAVSD
jgi:hypothetical protein